MRKLLFILLLLSTSAGLRAEDGHQLWLRKQQAVPVKVVSSATNSPVVAMAKQELQQGWRGKAGASVSLTLKKDKAIKYDGFRLIPNGVQATTEAGLLYGVFEMLRRQQTGQAVSEGLLNPSYEHRLLNHWDNPDGSVERGYAGQSIFWRKDNALVTTAEDKTRWQQYARANASVGINGAVINNVNASQLILTPEYLVRVKAIADAFRPYGVKVYLAVKFTSPALLGGLKTSDPLDPAVAAWWQSKTKEIYKLVPDFGGFLVKASSEGQPGPQDYGRTHADGANMLADAVKPYGGMVMWRAFVYSPNDKDRAKQAYNEFVPLDGKFRDNVIIQVKNGPVDFQPREPFSPLFGALKKTSVMPEFQITQEYLGHAIDLVFLSTMWEECLQSDTYQAGTGSTVARCTDGSVYPQKHTAMAGVSNVGLDTNWTGHDFAQANWYAFGRLAWNNSLKSAQIADEWLKLTFYGATAPQSAAPKYAADWNTNFLAPVKQMMLDSRETAVNYSMPLGLHHIMSATRGHYGPGPWWAPPKMRADWTPPYYHQADSTGVGFNRTRTGSNAVSQYHEPLASQLNDPQTCPDEYLLWFHHLPWDFRMKSGHTLWEELGYHYDKGVQQVRQFQKVWDKAQPYVDAERFAVVQYKLRSQSGNAVQWKDACLLYFQQFSHMPLPAAIEPPASNLDAIIANDMRPRRQEN
ncbi:alpha-glucuronidase [Hymenobacter taeanensis]|uniref:Alpha-glucuronidase n=1 Tax=Hymenobacter taeanensis TaxID=2735321 RepID=A0A6M6BLT0_9BACT|nr:MULTISPECIES: alpha-glucuronidase [Hymenobacter]QJX48939.1 alpha-glucuronidase [Hymenobacter taeanensis]UOQ81545.1 alpha-glucuronidase [Hymenobacter sp. 5414T-23]